MQALLLYSYRSSSCREQIRRALKMHTRNVTKSEFVNLSILALDVFLELNGQEDEFSSSRLSYSNFFKNKDMLEEAKEHIRDSIEASNTNEDWALVCPDLLDDLSAVPSYEFSKEEMEYSRMITEVEISEYIEIAMEELFIYDTELEEKFNNSPLNFVEFITQEGYLNYVKDDIYERISVCDNDAIVICPPLDDNLESTEELYG